MKAYCEPGCKDYQCRAGDVHVYRRDGSSEVTIRVAHQRVVDPEPLPEAPSLAESDPRFGAELGKYHREVFAIARREVREPIGGPYDGEVLTAPSPLACAVVLNGLRSDGYIVPERITAALLEEVNVHVPGPVAA